MSKLAALLLFSAGLAAAQPSALPKYKVLEAYPSQKAATDLNAAADLGYRFLFAGKFVVLRLDAAPPDTYRYQPRPDNTHFNAFMNELTLRGALGYGWLPYTQFLEKQPHPRNYEYASFAAMSQKAREANIAPFAAQGFTEVGAFQSWTILMREMGVTKPAAELQSARVVYANNGKKLMKEISALGSHGYRFRTPELPPSGGMSASMEQCGSACGGPFEFRAFDGTSAAQIEQTLNTFAQEGFRAVAPSLVWSQIVVERPASHAQRSTYRVAEADDASAVEAFLNFGDRDGFTPIGFTVHSGWKLHYDWVLEKPATAAP